MRSLKLSWPQSHLARCARWLGLAPHPPSRRDIIGSVWVAVILTCITSCFILFGSELVALWGLDRRRLNACEAEWRTTGPLWSGHLS